MKIMKQSKAWNHTSLMGPEKLKVLQNFDFSKIFRYSRACQIRNLWNSFLELYNLMQDFQIDPIVVILTKYLIEIVYLHV
jgi:hypothetical protein